MFTEKELDFNPSAISFLNCGIINLKNKVNNILNRLEFHEVKLSLSGFPFHYSAAYCLREVFVDLFV